MSLDENKITNILVKLKSDVYVLSGLAATTFLRIHGSSGSLTRSQLDNDGNIGTALSALSARNLVIKSGSVKACLYSRNPQGMLIAEHVSMQGRDKVYGDIAHCFFHKKDFLVMSGIKAEVLAYLITHPRSYSYGELVKLLSKTLKGRFSSLNWNGLVTTAVNELKKLDYLQTKRIEYKNMVTVSLSNDPPRIVFRDVKTLTRRLRVKHENNMVES